MEIKLALIDEVKVNIAESFPVQVFVLSREVLLTPVPHLMK